MPKTPKSSSTRKPPVPSESRADIENWIADVRSGIQPIVEYLDKAFRTSIPGLHHAIKWQKAYYGLPELGWIIEVAAYHVSVNIVFHGGADFDTPPPLGETDRARYVKLTSLADAKAPEVQAWIAQAGRVVGWK